MVVLYTSGRAFSKEEDLLSQQQVPYGDLGVTVAINTERLNYVPSSDRIIPFYEAVIEKIEYRDHHKTLSDGAC